MRIVVQIFFIFFKNVFDKDSSIKEHFKISLVLTCVIYLLRTEEVRSSEVRIKYKYSCSCIFVSFFVGLCYVRLVFTFYF